MPKILESIVTTRDADDQTHIAPMGVHCLDRRLLLKPFRPSQTLENLQREGCAVVNRPDDIRVYAGCLTGRYEWPLTSAEIVPCQRLENCLSHAEVEVESFDDDPVRPTFTCKIVHETAHAPFQGYNRAQAAVIELAILVSRLGRLPDEKIRGEIEYLEISIEKTAGEIELEAWNWLMERVHEHFAPKEAAS